MDQQQEVAFDDDQSPDYLTAPAAGADEDEDFDKGAMRLNETFSNVAINRQVNYVSDTPVNVDFSSFDKLQIVHQTCQEDQILSKNDSFVAYMEAVRRERIGTLCSHLEDSSTKLSEVVVMKERTHSVEMKPKNAQTQSHATLLLMKITGFFAIELSLTHTLPHLFSQENLRATWNLTQTSL